MGLMVSLDFKTEFEYIYLNACKQFFGGGVLLVEKRVCVCVYKKPR